MTSSSVPRGVLLLALAALQVPALATLGEQRSVQPPPVQTGGAQRSLAASAYYTLQEVQQADGSRLQEYLAPNGVVFAVQWNTLYKPELSRILGSYFPGLALAAQQAAQRGGLQRQFRHDNTDLVVQATGHLHVYAGHAYVRSLLPHGVTPQSLGWEP